MGFYGNVDDFETYHESRGRVIPVDWDDDYIESALLVASEWLDGQYGNVWSGYPTGGYTQERLWPRTSAVTNTYPEYIFEDDQIPDNVIKATYEAAFREATTQGSLQKDFTPNKYTSVSVDGAISVDYNTSIIQASDTQIQIPVIERLMQPLLNNSAQGSFSFYSGGASRV